MSSKYHQLEVPFTKMANKEGQKEVAAQKS